MKFLSRGAPWGVSGRRYHACNRLSWVLWEVGGRIAGGAGLPGHWERRRGDAELSTNVDKGGARVSTSVAGGGLGGTPGWAVVGGHGLGAGVSVHGSWGLCALRDQRPGFAGGQYGGACRPLDRRPGGAGSAFAWAHVARCG